MEGFLTAAGELAEVEDEEAVEELADGTGIGGGGGEIGEVHPVGVEEVVGELGERGHPDALRPTPTVTADRIYKLFRALIELSPQEATEYMVRRKDVHAILTGLRAVLLPQGPRGGGRSG